LTQSHDDAVTRAARFLADALAELQSAATNDAAIRDELAHNRAGLEALAQRIDMQRAEDKEQRGVLAGQLTNLAGSLDRLVGHLDGLSRLMADLIERLASTPEPQVQPPSTGASEPVFRSGGEGVSLTIVSVPGFQVLMDIQKALMGMEQVAGASVERFQEGDSRLQLQLRGPISATELAGALGRQTGHAFAIEESRPELMRLRLKIVS
jgi:hypothetical protein